MKNTIMGLPKPNDLYLLTSIVPFGLGAFGFWWSFFFV